MLWKNVDTFEGKWTEAGFMDSKGKWTTPLTKEHVLFEEDWETVSLTYCGNGVYASSDGYYEYICFSSKTGETYKYSGLDFPYYSEGYVIFNYPLETKVHRLTCIKWWTFYLIPICEPKHIHKCFL